MKMHNLLLPLRLHSFGELQALFIGEIFGSGERNIWVTVVFQAFYASSLWVFVFRFSGWVFSL